ncbi:MAG: potassium channel family protein [Armatimonadetes bacterium]|nr:potassium channel family protein [Armatimonadota bacterium]
MTRLEGLRPRRIREWLEDAIELPMVALSLVFLALVILEIAVSLSPSWSRLVSLAQWGIWTLFAFEFVIKLALAPDKRTYLRRNWLAVLSVGLPFLRVFRSLRAVRALRALKLARLAALTGRSTRQVLGVLQHRGAGYVALITLLVTFFGAAGMFLVERGHPGSEIRTFGDALWWSAASITSVGSNLAPVTPEGRFLAVTIFLFGMVVIGYITALLASYFVGKQIAPPQPPSPADHAINQAKEEAALSPAELQAKVDQLIALLDQRAEEQQQHHPT